MQLKICVFNCLDCDLIDITFKQRHSIYIYLYARGDTSEAANELEARNALSLPILISNRCRGGVGAGAVIVRYVARVLRRSDLCHKLFDC